MHDLSNYEIEKILKKHFTGKLLDIVMKDINTECDKLVKDSTLNNIFHKSKLIKNIDSIDWDCGEEYQEGILEILVDSYHGRYMPRYLCNMFYIKDCQDPDSEEYWNHYTEIESQLSDCISEWLQKDLETKNISFYVGNNDCSDCCIFAIRTAEKYKFICNNTNNDFTDMFYCYNDAYDYSETYNCDISLNNKSKDFEIKAIYKVKENKELEFICDL